MSENLTQKAYHHLHNKLTTGDLKPGFRLSNRAVAAEVGISFTPVREALNRLVSEGLLEYQEGVGVFVPTPSRQEIEEIYEVREMLECEVVKRACGNLSQSIIEEMSEYNEQMEKISESVQETERLAMCAVEFRELDTAFHLVLLRGTGNRKLLDTVSDLRKVCAIKTGGAQSFSNIIGHVFKNEPTEHMMRTHKEHKAILDALQSGDAQQAASVTKQHIKSGRQLALRSYDRTYMSG